MVRLASAVMRNDDTVRCPTCGLAVPAGIATCPRDETPLDGSGLAPPPPPVEDHPWPDPEPEPAPAAAPLPPTRPPSLAQQVDPMVGMQLGEYQVKALIGVGGMGLVYRGVQPVIGKPVAIKVLRPEISESPSHMERLLVEARAVNAVRHRGIIDIFSFGQLPDGRQYFVMEYLQGQALDEYIQTRGPLAPNEAVTYLQEIASALHAAHLAGVVHRDLKPNNIYLVKQAGGRYVKLLDFGLAKQGVTQHGTTPQSRTGLVVGTPEYIAPEQARGEAVGPRTDLYSLGVVAFQMLTGELPFNGKTAMDFVIAHLQQRPPKAIELMPDIPEQLSNLVDRMMEKAPEMRPASADVVRRELKAIGRSLPQDTTFVGTPGAAAQPLPHAPEPPAAQPVPAPHASGESQPPAPSPVAPTSHRAVFGWVAGGALMMAAAAGVSFVAFRAFSGPATDEVPTAVVAEVTTPPQPPPPAPPPASAAQQQAVAAPDSPPPQPVPADGHDSPAATPAVALAKLERPRPDRNHVAAATQPPATPAGPLDARREKLLQRIQELSKALEVRPNRAASDPKKASALLMRAEQDARAAQDEAALTTIDNRLRSFETFFLEKP